MAEIKLLSELGTNYTELHDFLAKGEYLNADAATSILLLKIIGKKYYESLTYQDIEILLWFYSSA